ncbi:MAG: hypothetical protein KGZ39_03230, partial [Simkania sp.]|nr:hypothetical protein [Simkania sp.]
EAQGVVISQTGSSEQIIEILAPLQAPIEETIGSTVATLWGEKIKKRYAEEFDAIVERLDDQIQEICDNENLQQQEQTEDIDRLAKQQRLEEQALIHKKTKEWVERDKAESFAQV